MCTTTLIITGLVIKSLTPQPVGDPLQLAVMEKDSGMLDIGDESDGVMESIQYEEEGEGEGEGEEEAWVIDSRLLQKGFIAKQYSLALITYKNVSKGQQSERVFLSRVRCVCWTQKAGWMSCQLTICTYCVWKTEEVAQLFIKLIMCVL